MPDHPKWYYGGMSKFTSKIDPGKKQAWLRALAEDDAQAVLSLLDANPGIDAWSHGPAKQLLCEVMAYNPLPHNSLDLIDQAHPITGRNWFVAIERAVGSTGQPVDWGAILRWRKQASPQTAKQEAEDGFNIMLIEFMEARQRGLSNARYRKALLEILDMYPDVASRVDFKTVPPLYLFSLATARKDKNWLARSGLNIEEVIYQGVKSGLAGEMPHQADQGQVSPSLSEWINSHPSYRQAWDKLQSWDAQRDKAREDWLNKWANGTTYQESAIGMWVEAELAQGDPRDMKVPGSPLDHPYFHENAVSINKNHLKVAVELYDVYKKTLVRSGRYYRLNLNYPNRRILQEINPAWREDLYIGMDPVLLRVSNSFSLANEIMSDPEQRKTGEMIFESLRMRNVLAQWKPNDILRWAGQDHWAGWRSSGGQSLVEVFLDSGSYSSERKGRINKAYITRLAKKDPELFLGKIRGAEIIKRLDLDEQTASLVVRSALTSVSSKVMKSKAQPGRTVPGPKPKPKM